MADQSLLPPIGEGNIDETPVETLYKSSTLLHWVFVAAGTPVTSPRARATQYRLAAGLRVVIDITAWLAFAGTFGIRVVSFDSGSLLLILFATIANAAYALIPVTTVARYAYLTASTTPSRHILPSQLPRMRRVVHRHLLALAVLFAGSLVLSGIVGGHAGKTSDALLLCTGAFVGGFFVVDVPLLATTLLLAAECGRLRDAAAALERYVAGGAGARPRGDAEAAGGDAEAVACQMHADACKEEADASRRARVMMVTLLALCLSLSVQALVEVYVHAFSVARPSYEDLAHVLVVIVFAVVAAAAAYPTLSAVSAIHAAYLHTLPALATTDNPAFPVPARARLLACLNASPLQWDIFKGYSADAKLLQRTVLGTLLATIPAAVRAGMGAGA